MEENMAARRKKSKKIKSKSSSVAAKKNNKRVKNKNIDFSNVQKFFYMVIKAPFVFINFLSLNVFIILKNTFIHLIKIITNILKLSSGIKEAIFGIIFGFLSGAIGAVIILSYLDLNTKQQDLNFAENKLMESQTLIDINTKIDNAILTLEKYEKSIEYINNKLIDLNNSNNIKLEEINSNIEGVINEAKLNNDQYIEYKKEADNQFSMLESRINQTSKLMLSSSKTELSNRLYLAQSLVDRLKSGVPYAPQLIALGKEGLDPALLRFAKGGAPTLSDLTARLSVRAGELRDAYKTRGDTTWKDNLKSEISKLVTIKPTDSSKIKGMEGVLLRAEEAISKGNLEKAIDEIDSLEVSARGVLGAWLLEAKAKQNASIAAENLLAKTTAALRKRN